MKKETIENETENCIDNTDLENEKKLYDFFRSRRLTILIAARDFLWGFDGWKNKNLDDFLDNEKPEVIYMHNFNTIYMHRIYHYILKRTKAKGVIFFTDDNCSFKQINFSPLFWMYRVIYLKYVKKSVSLSHKLFGITTQMCDEYEKIFKRPIQILYKGGLFNEESRLPYIKKKDGIIKIVYAGNILAGRWETLGYIASSILSINDQGKKYELYIYTADFITDKIRKAISISDDVHLMPAVNATELPAIYEESDILLHVESMHLKEKYSTRLSFSTKLVDYFMSGRCILAVGWEKAASIDYLKKNDAAIIATNVKLIYEKMNEIVNNDQIVNQYAKKSYECGRRNHDIKIIKQSFNELL